MAHFAKLDSNNIVLEVLVVNNEVLDSANEEQSGIDFLSNIFNHSNWKQTSYSKSFRKHYASIGMTYDSELDAFIDPKCHDIAVLDTSDCVWDCNHTDHDVPILIPQCHDEAVFNKKTMSWICDNSDHNILEA